MAYSEDSMSAWGVVIFVGFVLAVILAVAVFIPLSRAFSRELRYVKMKMLNSREEKERAYWEKRKKQLWLSLLPFYHYHH